MALISAASAWGTPNLSSGLLKVIEKGLPLGCCDHKVFVGILHGAAGVLLRSTGSPAEHFRNKIFEACRRKAMMGLVYPWVRIQCREPRLTSVIGGKADIGRTYQDVR